METTEALILAEQQRFGKRNLSNIGTKLHQPCKVTTTLSLNRPKYVLESAELCGVSL